MLATRKSIGLTWNSSCKVATRVCVERQRKKYTLAKTVKDSLNLSYYLNSIKGNMQLKLWSLLNCITCTLNDYFTQLKSFYTHFELTIYKVKTTLPLRQYDSKHTQIKLTLPFVHFLNYTRSPINEIVQIVIYTHTQFPHEQFPDCECCKKFVENRRGPCIVPPVNSGTLNNASG